MKKYKVILIDVPWLYRDKARAGKRGCEFQYPCLSMEDLRRLPMGILTEKDSVIFMWATFPMLNNALELIKCWGFKYVTGGFTWVKTNKDGSIFMGMGAAGSRSNAEVCLMARKGKGVKRVHKGIPNTQLHPRLKHSEKPKKFREDIEKLFGDVSRVEIFARDRALGWSSIGLDIDGRNIREVLREAQADNMVDNLAQAVGVPRKYIDGSNGGTPLQPMIKKIIEKEEGNG